ncbi:camphor resistance protein CrcB [Mesobacillus persicus]|uniref:Fluoride-specific ion channel FluC n=1 Tax=Mesobacillus persicus TaxID=930146 RepID=A0A1H8GZU5_9BACI|nr:fluoride efflux transporter CrcB [Mesobacillus persicus]SEN49622.1 camphor resistance protein CrcB [Mesobacillus persicus]
MQLILVGLGGFLGAMARFGIGEWLYMENGFPVGTLLVNLLGCLALGWFLAFAKRKKVQSEYVLLIGTGFLGSFTTFSTFSVESIDLLTSGSISVALFYLLTTILAGVLLAFIGFKIGSTEGGMKS